MFPIIGIAILISAVLCILTGFWLSLPATVRFAPPQSFIDALPTWLQGPRRRAPFIPEPLTPVASNEQAEPARLHMFSSSYALIAELAKPAPEEPVSIDEPHSDTQHNLAVPVTPAPIVASDEEHGEAAQAEVVHDEP